MCGCPVCSQISMAVLEGVHDWQSTLAAVDSLISGKKRSDGKNWAHAFDMMDLYLEVGVLVAYACFAWAHHAH